MSTSLPSFAYVDSGGPLEAVFPPQGAGSLLTFSFYFEEETFEGSGVWQPKDFSGQEFISQARVDVYTAGGTVETIAVSNGAQAGYLNFTLGADRTALYGGRELHWAFLMHPIGEPQNAKLMIKGTIPFEWTGYRP